MLTCRVSVPANPHDTCPLTNGPVLIGGTAPGAMAERTLDMGTSLDELPPDQQLMLTKVAGGALSSAVGTAQGLVGDHYLADDGTVASAAEPLQATLLYTLNLDANRASPSTPPQCVTFSDFGDTGPDQGYWPIEAHVVVSWRYTFADGSTATAPGIGQAVAPSDTLIELDVTWNGQWQVTLAPQADSLCQFAMEAFANSDRATAGTGVQQTASSATSGTNPADGCFIALSTADATGAIQGPAAYMLYRFGLLLTVNTQARQLFPMLPQANAHEQALAQQMGQRISGP
jgi:hypothetical protein